MSKVCLVDRDRRTVRIGRHLHRRVRDAAVIFVGLTRNDIKSVTYVMHCIFTHGEPP